MDDLETKFLQSQSLQPLVWFRYIDDIFFIWTHGNDKLEKFLDDLNSFDNNIKFTHESSKDNVIFLDLIVKLSKGRLTTDLHVKDTDRHQYLHFNSSHPDHTKRSIIYSQALRLAKICTFENDFLRHRDEMKSWFQRRSYPEDVINTEMKKVIFNGNSGKSSNKSKGVPFVLTYHPLLKKVNYIPRKHSHLLYMNDEVKKVFQPGTMVLFGSPRNLSSYLVRAKMYPVERKTGSYKCKGNRCQVCLNVSETETFTSTVTHMSYKINHSFDCNDKCLIYLLTCKTCLKQYVGSTTDCSRYRWNNYKCNDRKNARGKACLQEHLFEHFNSEGHNGFLLDVSVTLIDKTDAKILSKKNTTGDIPSKRWHLMFLMLKMICKLQFTCIFILLVPCTDLLLISIVILVIAIIML